MISTAQIHWIAALLEGEGTFCYSSPLPNGNRSTIRIALSMIDKDVVTRFANLLGFGSIGVIKGCESRPKIQYRWYCAGGDAAGLMMTIYSLMGERRQAKIRELLAFWKTKRQYKNQVKARKSFAF